MRLEKEGMTHGRPSLMLFFTCFMNEPETNLDSKQCLFSKRRYPAYTRLNMYINLRHCMSTYEVPVLFFGLMFLTRRQVIYEKDRSI